MQGIGISDNTLDFAVDGALRWPVRSLVPGGFDLGCPNPALLNFTSATSFAHWLSPGMPVNGSH